MNAAQSASNSSVSWLRLTCDMLFAVLFLTALSAATTDLILGRLIAAAGAIVATLVFGWAGRGMIQHLDRWCANWEE